MNEHNNAPRLVNWAGYLAITFVLLLPVSVLTVRSGAWQQGLILYALACLGATLVMIVCITLLLLPRFAAWRKNILLRGLIALPGTLLLLSLTAGGDYPLIHDITTDTADPPTFTMAQEYRGEGSNTLDVDPQTISAQVEAYPELQTLHSSLSIDDAFTRALDVAARLGWNIYHQDRNTGVIEAVETTRIMGFKDDIVIRVRGNANGALLDLRSVSRVGEGDIGANAKRIQAFYQAFEVQGE